MTTTDPFLAGGDSLPGVKFANVGDTITGQIIEARQVPDRDLEGNVRKWDNGDDRTVWVFDLDTDSDGAADQSLWVRGNMFTAIKAALIEAGVSTQGAVVKVTHHALGDPPKKGYHAPKLFECKAKAGPPLRPKTADAFTDEAPF